MDRLSNLTQQFNTSRNGTDLQLVTPFSEEAELALTILYVVICLCALTLNSLVCFVYLTGRVRASNFNVLLMVLSVADISSAISILPYVFVDVYKVSVSSRHKDSLCALTTGGMLFWVSTFVSVFVLCLISVNRYFLINHPTRARWLRNKRALYLLFVLFWLVSIALWWPTVLTFRYNNTTGICCRHWPRNFNVTLYTLSTFLLGVTFPVTLMLCTFLATSRTLWGKTFLTKKESAVARGRKRVVSLLGILIVAYFICSFPSALYFILSRATNVFSPGLEGEILRMKVSRFVVLLALLNTVLDPTIYALRCNEYREALKSLCCDRPGQASVVTLSDLNVSSSGAPQRDKGLRKEDT